MSRPAMSHEPFAEWAALASIQALDGDEQARFYAHLAAGCAECEETQRELARAAAALPLALPDAHVPPELRARLMAQIGSAPPAARLSAPAPRSRVRSTSWRWAAGLVAAGVVGIMSWDQYHLRSALERQQASLARLEHELAGQRALTSLVSGTDSSVASLKGTAPAPQADGWIAWSPSRKRGFLVVHNLPLAPAGKQYQLWVLAAGQPAPAGVFDVDTLGHASLVVPVEAPQPDGFAITLEPSGGAPAPSGSPFMTSPPSRG
jgi:anti-sigma-K factor RskA